MEAFPSIIDLAKAPEEKVLRLWQGLGYYSRARNLHATAKYVTAELNGKFPNTYTEIIKLKGVGPYTAAAIASICFDEPEPVVDGNVFRFAARYFGIGADISKGGSRKVFEKTLKKEILNKNPGMFNQAMMEYGATVCAPNPQCDGCEFRLECYAFKKGAQRSFPVKSGKTKVRDRHFSYVVLKNDKKLFLKERKEKGIWQGLFDFYLIEAELKEEDVLKHCSENLALKSLVLEEVSELFLHILSHQKIHAHFYLITISDVEARRISQNHDLKSFSKEEILNLPKPKLIVNYLERVGIK